MARLSTHDIASIKQSTTAVLGESTPYIVWLFGSRANDRLRGSDIDLFIETSADIPNRAIAMCQIYAKIILSIGDRKVDILLKDGKTKEYPIFDIARSTGVRL